MACTKISVLCFFFCFSDSSMLEFVRYTNFVTMIIIWSFFAEVCHMSTECWGDVIGKSLELAFLFNGISLVSGRLVSWCWHWGITVKGPAGAPSVWSPLLAEEKMRPSQWLDQCFVFSSAFIKNPEWWTTAIFDSLNIL